MDSIGDLAIAHLSILDVGHGNSAVLLDGQEVIIIDAGGGSALLEFLNQQSIRRVSVLLISHADEDHIRGTIALLASASLEIGSVQLNSDAARETKLWRDLVYELDKANTSGHLRFDVGLTTNHSNVFRCGHVTVEILYPSPGLAAKGVGGRDHRGRTLSSHSLSAIMRISVGGRPAVLLPGDMDSIALTNLQEAGVGLETPIVVFPHHGGKPGGADPATFAAEFCRLVKPRVVIFSIGRGKHGNPRPEIVSAIVKSGRSIRVACTQLSEHCATNLPQGRPTHLTEMYSDGRDLKRCCAGTLTIDLDDQALAILPDEAGHRLFINNHAPTALCK